MVLCQLQSTNFSLLKDDVQVYFTRVPSIGEKICVSGPLGGTFLVQDVLHYATGQNGSRIGCLAVLVCQKIGDSFFIERI